MNPDQAAKLNELYEWMQERKRQQLTAPVDDISKLALGVVTDVGLGSSTNTQSIIISSTPQTITVPKNPTGTVLLNLASGQYEIPYL